MSDATVSGTKKRGPGRPKVGAIQIQVRMPPAELAVLDAWIKKQGKDKPTRPEAIRRLVALALERR
jgi:hypothetical protein